MYPSMLDKIMDRLQQQFGQPSAILSAVVAKLDNLPALDAELTNVALVAGEVDHLRCVFNMLEQNTSDVCLVQKIEDKLPLTYAARPLRHGIARPHRRLLGRLARRSHRDQKGDARAPPVEAEAETCINGEST